MVVEEVLHILHALLDFNSTEIISHSPFWAECLQLCQWESPDLKCEHSMKKVFPSVLLDWSTGLQHLQPLSNWPFNLPLLTFILCHLSPPLFLHSSAPISIAPIYPWITPFLQACSNSSDIHGNQATASTSTTKRSTHDSSGKDLTFYILTISVCDCLYRDWQR